MNAWGKRLKYYGIGFGLGLIFIFFFFRNRGGCSWLPENRVKYAILDRLVVISEETSQALKRKGVEMNDDELMNVLSNGDVLFSESKKEGDSKVYVIERNAVKYCFTLPYESFLSEIRINEGAKESETSTKGIGRIIRFPADSSLIWVDTSSQVRCQQERLGLSNTKDILKWIRQNGRVDFELSDLSFRPKPKHRLIFEKDHEQIGAEVVWYKNKLNILSFESERSQQCK